MIEVEEDLIVARKIPNQESCYSWTITLRLGDALRISEEMFGIRDKNYTILGVEYEVNKVPHVWYPSNSKNIIIRLNSSCLTDINQAIYQLAHEVIHCLSPSGGVNANVLEEGLATYFARYYMKVSQLGNDWNTCSDNYLNADHLVEKLLIMDKDIIKKIRELEPEICKITPEQLIFVNKNVDRDLAEQLCQKFT